MIPPEPGMCPKSTCFYHTQIPSSEAILKLLSVLQVLEEQENPGDAAPEIMRGLFRITREFIKNDTGPVYSKAQVTYQSKYSNICVTTVKLQSAVSI